MAESLDFYRDVDDAMRLFRRSMIGSADALTPTRPSRLMVVVDGSPQDDTSIRMAGDLRARFDVETLVLDARERPDPGSARRDAGDAQAGGRDLAAEVAGQINGARPIARGDGEAYEAILEALDQHRVDLVAVPSPFGRSFEKVGSDSVGTVIDVLLSRCPVPLLVIRRDDQDFHQCCGHIDLLVATECDVEARAAAWAFGLATSTAEVSLNLIVQREHYENIRSIVRSLHPDGDFDSEALSDALAQSHQRLHGAMSKTADQTGCRYHLLPQSGQAATTNSLADPQQRLLVVPVEVDDSFGQGFARDRLKSSPHPVLIVAGHVRA